MGTLKTKHPTPPPNKLLPSEHGTSEGTDISIQRVCLCWPCDRLATWLLGWASAIHDPELDKPNTPGCAANPACNPLMV